MKYVVRVDKITKYLLNPFHRTGAPKAKFFMAKGFSAANADQFAEVLKRHPAEATLTAAAADPEGRKLTYECEIASPDGSRTCIRSIWIEAQDGSYTRLISVASICT